MRNRLVLLLLAIGLNFGLIAHDLHLSVLEIQWNKDATKLECALKVFTDDIQVSIANVQLDLGWENKDYLTVQNARTVNYLLNSLLFQAPGNASLNLIGEEVEGIVTWYYFELEFHYSGGTVFKERPSKYSVVLENRLLLDQFDDQENIVHVIDGDEKESFLLDRYKRILTLP
jgi:hypothetical protein